MINIISILIFLVPAICCIALFYIPALPSSLICICVLSTVLNLIMILISLGPFLAQTSLGTLVDIVFFKSCKTMRMIF